jgi:alanine racemase
MSTLEQESGGPGITTVGFDSSLDTPSLPMRPAWVEVDLNALADNFQIIRRELPSTVRLLYVLKDEAYGQGAIRAAQVALANGVDQLAVYTLEEAVRLREAGIQAPILLLGERTPEELPWLPARDLTPCIGSMALAQNWDGWAQRLGRRLPVHLKINTGMNRFGFSWREADQWSSALSALDHLEWTGVLSHFAQSDEADKAFALVQLERFQKVVSSLAAAGIRPKVRHLCNSGGFLDLPEAHLDMVRIGLLAQGVYPSQVCRRLNGLTPVLSVKARISAVQHLEVGDSVGYGMRYTASERRRIGVIPLGYGDGFPRVRNEGHVLVDGCRAPLVGGVAMDALMIDLTEIPTADVGSEAVLMGRQGQHEICVHELARLKKSVSYDVLVGWRSRLPRLYRGSGMAGATASRFR